MLLLHYFFLLTITCCFRAADLDSSLLETRRQSCNSPLKISECADLSHPHNLRFTR
jgi:hypothetical protein